VVLIERRAEGLAAIEANDLNSRAGLFEYSAPEGSEPDDPAALTMANPNVHIRLSLDDLVQEGKRAKAASGETLTGWLTEVLCIHVVSLNRAVDMEAWAKSYFPDTMDGLRDRLGLFFEVSLDELHATVYLAAVDHRYDGKVRVEVAADYTGPTAVRDLEMALPGLVSKIQPKVVGWLPGGPAASVARTVKTSLPKWIKAEEIRTEASAVCMSFSAMVRSEFIIHSHDPLLDQHLSLTEKLYQGDVWRFSRRGNGWVDAAYAAAGAVYIAKTIKPPPTGDMIFPE
jgi:hypothetical protein